MLGLCLLQCVGQVLDSALGSIVRWYMKTESTLRDVITQHSCGTTRPITIQVDVSRLTSCHVVYFAQQYSITPARGFEIGAVDRVGDIALGNRRIILALSSGFSHV